MMRAIDSNEFKKILVDITKNIHDFCVKNDIHYSLAYGSAIGAVRHKGIIPWDDDIDLVMLRADYERFIREYQDTKGIYAIHSLLNDNDYELPFAKVEDTRTVLDEHMDRKEKMGVNIDIFPIDDLADSRKESMSLLKKVSIRRFLCFAKIVRPSNKNSFFKKIGIFCFHILLMPFTLRRLCEKVDEKAKAISRKNSKYVACTVWCYGAKELMEKDVYSGYHLVPFEGEQFYLMDGYDTFLKTIYGDYMQLPPEGQRESPHTIDNVYWK